MLLYGKYEYAEAVRDVMGSTFGLKGICQLKGYPDDVIGICQKAQSERAGQNRLPSEADGISALAGTHRDIPLR